MLNLVSRLAPDAHDLAVVDVGEIAVVGLPRARARTPCDLAAAAMRGELEFGPTATVENVAEMLRRVRGIGKRTAQYVAMRALRIPDAFLPPTSTCARSPCQRVNHCLRKNKFSPAPSPGGLGVPMPHCTSAIAARRHAPRFCSMRTPHYYAEMLTPLGTVCLCGTELGLTGLFMETHRHGAAEAGRGGWQRDDARFADARAQLTEYFAGQRQAFDIRVDRDATGGTEFQRRVWAALAAIPYGMTISYGELARRIGQPAAVRAVGLANGRNPLSIIVPCHRVVGANGTLTGYGGGMERKRWLLDLEQDALRLS